MQHRNLALLSGAAGLAGALLLAIGDQCLYFASVSGVEFVHGLRQIVANAPTARVLLGATLAPFAALLYLIGFWHVYMHLRARSPRLAAVVWTGLSLCILAGTCYHALWGVKALTIQAIGAAAVAQPALAALEAQVHGFAANIFLIAEIAGYPSLALLAILVVSGQTSYPRWFVFLTPAVPIVVLQMVGPYAPAPLGSLLNGSASNLSFGLFFAASLAIRRDANEPRPARTELVLN
jgi:hypothetical protein